MLLKGKINSDCLYRRFKVYLYFDTLFKTPMFSLYPTFPQISANWNMLFDTENRIDTTLLYAEIFLVQNNQLVVAT